MIYSTNRISYKENNMDMFSNTANMCFEEISLLFEDINKSIFETAIGFDFNEALQLKSLKEKDDNSSAEEKKEDSSNTSSSNSSVEEKEKKKTLWEKVKAFFNTIIEKIKGLLSSIQDKFYKVINLDQKLYEKHKDILNMKNLEGFDGVDECLPNIDQLLKAEENYQKIYQEYLTILNNTSVKLDEKKSKLEQLNNEAEKYNNEIDNYLNADKIKWKPSSDSEIKSICNALVNDHPKRIKELEKFYKNSIDLTNKLIQNDERELNKSETTEEFKNFLDLDIKCGKILINILNKATNLSKVIYKEYRKKFITMLNYAKRKSSGKIDDKEESTEESAYMYLLSERSDQYVDSMLNISTTNIVEESLLLSSEINEDFNDLFKNEGIHELKEFVECKDLVLYEGTKFDDIKEKIINYFKDVLEKIKKFYNDIIDKIDSKINDYYKKIGNNLSKISNADLNLIENDKLVSSLGTIYEYDLDKFDDYYKGSLKIAEGIQSKCNSFINNGVNQSDLDSYFNNKKSSYIKECTGINAETITELAKELRNKHEKKIEVSKSYIIKNWKNIEDSVKGGNIKRRLKKSYEGERKAIDKILNDVKKMKGENSSANVIKVCSTLLMNISTLMNNVNSVNIDLAVKEFKMNYMIAFKVAKLTGHVDELKK